MHRRSLLKLYIIVSQLFNFSSRKRSRILNIHRTEENKSNHLLVQWQEKKKERNLTFFGLPPPPSQPIIRRTIKIAKVLALKITLLQAAFLPNEGVLSPPPPTLFFSHRSSCWQRNCFFYSSCCSIEPTLDRIKK